MSAPGGSSRERRIGNGRETDNGTECHQVNRNGGRDSGLTSFAGIVERRVTRDPRARSLRTGREIRQGRFGIGGSTLEGKGCGRRVKGKAKEGREGKARGKAKGMGRDGRQARGRDGRQAKGRERDKTAERDSETRDKEREMGKALK